MKLKEIRQAEAKERAAFYKKLTPEEKIKQLDKRLGKGVGAVKERKRLTKHEK